jgi:hypothetical protein
MRLLEKATGNRFLLCFILLLRAMLCGGGTATYLMSKEVLENLFFFPSYKYILRSMREEEICIN